MVSLALSGCTLLKGKPRLAPAPAPATVAAPSPNPAAPPLAAPATAPFAVLPLPAATPPRPDAGLVLASYAERVRSLSAPELAAELTRLGPSTLPLEQLQLALALSQLKQVPELSRAQDIVGKVMGNTSDEAKAVHPLARLLAVRLAEERRLEDLLDKQNQQVKDLQRRLDQTTERLEALKAIERSLVSRPAPPAAPLPGTAPGSRVRTPLRSSVTPQP